MARWQCRAQIVFRFGLLLFVLAALTVSGCTPSSDETGASGSSRHAGTHLDLALPRQTATGTNLSDIICIVVRVTAADLEQPTGATATLSRGAASIELTLDVPVGFRRMFEVEAFAEVEACAVDAISPSFVPNFIPLFNNASVITQDITTDGATIRIPMAPLIGLVVRSPAPPVNTDGDEVQVQLVARDPSAAPLTFSATGLPLGLSIDPMSGLITGTLSRDASVSSPYTVSATVSNGTDLDGVTFVWTVTNPAPILALPFVPVDSLIEGTVVALQAEASDPDGDPLMFSATGLPPGLSINASTGLISGTLTQSAAAGSPYTVSVTVSDGVASSSLDVILIVTNPVPVIASPGDQSSAEQASIGLQIEASDADGDALVFSAAGLPPNLTINPSTGLIAGTISSTAANGSPHMVTVEVSDGAGSSRITFTWVVNPVFPQISISDQTVLESNMSGAVFLVSLSAVTGRTVTVDFATANNSAIAGQDYQASNGQLVFNPGVTTQMLTVDLLDDGSDEPLETFFVNLSNAVNGDIADAQAVGTIQDEDGAPELSINNVTVTEGDSGTTAAVFTLTLSALSGFTVSVDFTTANGTAAAGEDYQAMSGTVVFPPGSPTQMLTVLVVGDKTEELDETFVVNLSNAANVVISDGQGVASITNDDMTMVSINDVIVTEGNAGPTPAVFTVTLSAPSSQPVSVNFATATTGNTATPEADFTATAGTLIFDPGTTTQTFNVDVVGDVQVEPDETFLVDLSAAVNAEIVDSQGMATITNDDVTPQLSINDVIVTEGNAGPTPAVFTVTLSAPSSQPVTVNFATAITGNTATPEADFTATAGTLTFAPGTTTQTFNVDVVGDVQVEPDETFLVDLSAAVNAEIVDPQGMATITDDDMIVLISDEPANEILRYDAATGAFLNVLVGDNLATPQDESGGMQSPGYVLLGSDQQLYIASQKTNEVLRYDAATGVFLGVLVGDNLATPYQNESGGLKSPGHLLLGSDQQLYVASQMTDEIFRYDATTGVFLGVLVRNDPATPNQDESDGLSGLSSMVFSPDGDLYVSSLDTNQILRYDALTGDFLNTFVGDDPTTLNQDESGGLLGPSSMVFSPDGRLYVSSLHTHEVLRYDGRTGAFLDIFVAASSGGLLAPSQLIFGPDGQLYVSSLHTQQILRYDGDTGVFLNVSVDLAASRGGLLNSMPLLFMSPAQKAR